MKTFLWKWSLGLSLVALLPLAGGCLQDHSNPTVNAVTNASPSPAQVVATPVEPATVTPEDLADTNAAAPDLVDAPARPISDERPLPPTINPTPPTSEVIKLANSGVDEGVMLAFVTNSANTFNLGADEIVYLTDIGVPGVVITAMIQQDQAMKLNGMSVPASSANSGSGNILVPTPGAPAAYAPPAAANAATATQPEPIAADPNSLNTAPPVPSGQQAEAAPPAPATAPTYQTFYDSLSPYGTWLEVDGYGRVWQPSVVVINRSWRPYFDNGRWIYTDLGWYWYSDYSWGWAPFHYGRWFRHARYGWCWTPDYVWGPSWVTWRYSSDYCGWAPLPPAAYYRPGFGFSYYGSSVGFSFGFGLGYDSYSFVHFRHFREPHLRRHCLPREHVTHVYHKTVVVNKIIGDNNTIINSGVPVEHVARATKKEVPRVPVRDMASAPYKGQRAEQVQPTGTLAVYRPQIAPAQTGGQRSAPRRPETATFSPRSSISAPRAESAPAAASSASSGLRTLRAPSRSADSLEPRAPSRSDVTADNRVAAPRFGTSSGIRQVPSRSSGTAAEPEAPRSAAPRDSIATSPGTPDRTLSRPLSRPESLRPQSPAPVPSRSAESLVRSPQTSGSGQSAAPSVRREAPTRPSSVTSSGSAPSPRQPTRIEQPASAGALSPRTTPDTRTVHPGLVYNQRSYATPSEQRAVASPRPSVPASPSGSLSPAPHRSLTAPSATPAPAVRSYEAPRRPMSQAPAISAPTRQYSAPALSSPSPTLRSPSPAPSYSAPSRPMSSEPRAYSAPMRSAPSPSYSAPSAAPAPRAAPSASYSAPSRPSYSAPRPSSVPSGGSPRAQRQER